MDLIKEFALGISNRHYFHNAKEISKYEKIDRDTFMSLYDYDDYVVEYFGNKKTLSGFNGKIHKPDEFILDVDGSNMLNAINKCKGLVKLLKELNVPYKIYFSGTGFHVNIPGTSFRWQPHEEMHLQVKKELKNKGIFEYADPSVTDKTRIIRVPNTKNTKSGFYKVPIENEWIDMDPEKLSNKLIVEGWAKYPREVKSHSNPFPETEQVFDVFLKEKPKVNKENKEVIATVHQDRAPDPTNHPCISKMLNSKPLGKRHMVALRIAAFLRWRLPEKNVRMIMEDWRRQVEDENHPFTELEMTKLIEGCYSGHNGSGYRFGCNDTIMDNYCKNTCKLFKAKSSQTTMTSTDMESVLVDWVNTDQKPIDIGAIYGQKFPVYPGEVVILQAPPKSMKTMLLQNWITALKKKTYFLEMEMSPRQMWSRFVMIENNWSEEEMFDHYRKGGNSMNKKFEWLTVDYSAPFDFELDKRISMLAVKPEIIVVDHMGLFKSKHKDALMKQEEVSQALMELAVKHNIVVLAVSEITKQAFKEGMDISSAKGSFRIAYNANKVLSLTPYKDPETGLIKRLKVVSTANREKENLNLMLDVKNVKITKGESYES